MGGTFALQDAVVSMQVGESAGAVVGVAGAASPVLSCWGSPGPAHAKGNSNFQQKNLAELFCSVASMGFPVGFFGDESTEVSSQSCTELQRGGQWLG